MQLDAINEKLFHALFDFARQSTALDMLGIFFAAYVPFFLVVGLLVSLIFIKDWRLRLFILIEALLAVLLGFGIVGGAIEGTYSHPRPFAALGFEPLIGGPESNSFPSRHAAFLFSLVPLVCVTNKKFGWWFAALSTLNGLARVFVGVHWPLDIIGGALVGAGSGYLIHVLMRPYRTALAPQGNKANTT